MFDRGEMASQSLTEQHSSSSSLSLAQRYAKGLQGQRFMWTRKWTLSLLSPSVPFDLQPKITLMGSFAVCFDTDADKGCLYKSGEALADVYNVHVYHGQR